MKVPLRLADNGIVNTGKTGNTYFVKMQTLWLTFKSSPVGRMKFSTFSAMIALFVILYITYKGLSKKKNMITEPYEPYSEKISDTDIKTYLYQLKDTRPSFCKFSASKTYTGYAQVSILIHFKDFEFERLKLTLASIAKYTPESLYSEILLLDDGTRFERVQNELNAYVAKHKTVTVYQSDITEGAAMSRYKLAELASNDILVFVNTDVVVNEGWLPPLVNKVTEQRNVIAVPHADNFLPGKRFYQMSNDLVPVLTWMLSTAHYKTSENTDLESIKSPIMLGNVFAIHKNLYQSLGSYDEQLTAHGGEDIELSLRTWLCGGEVHIVQCSRIVVHESQKVREVTNVWNIHRLAHLWFDDYKSIVFQQTRIKGELNDEEGASIRTRRKEIHRSLGNQCKPFSWYLENISPQLRHPSADANQFGKLKSKTGYCVSVQESSTHTELTLKHCKPHMYDQSMILEHDKFGFIKYKDLCLQAERDVVIVTACDVTKQTQLWNVKSNIINDAYPDKCLSHYTHTVKAGEYHHSLQLTQCVKGERRQEWEILPY